MKILKYFGKSKFVAEKVIPYFVKNSKSVIRVQTISTSKETTAIITEGNYCYYNGGKLLLL